VTDAAAVRVAVTGAVYVAPTGSTAPTDATTALDAAWKSVGYISEDGVVESNDTENEEVKAWQNSDIERRKPWPVLRQDHRRFGYLTHHRRPVGWPDLPGH